VKIIQPATPGGPPIFIGASNSKGLARAAKYGDGYISVGLAPQHLAEVAARLHAQREAQGQSGHFPIYCQVEPPASVEDGRALVNSYREAGADGLVLAEPLGKSDGFPADEAITEAVLAEARG
jgi:alkanesulfonate monooxygenase SsuD/methylene tetrahydromethanopterin reductase-like flavin-dependent oxidoreductase (luciferase family)